MSSVIVLLRFLNYKFHKRVYQIADFLCLQPYVVGLR
jgi:hypothetical protein